LANDAPVVVNGWTLYMHPLFAAQYRELQRQVAMLKSKDPAGYQKKNATKRLAAIFKLTFELIPQDPSTPEYRQGLTLGEGNKHWFKAKFFQQYRLFFRYHEPSKVIVYAWINDEKTKRAYNSKNDAYRVFAKMLASGNPPDSWDSLLNAVSSELPCDNVPR